MIKIDLKRHRKEIIGSVVVLLVLLGGMSVFKYTSFNSGFEIVDDLGGNEKNATGSSNTSGTAR